MASASPSPAYDAVESGSWWQQVVPVVVGLGGFAIYATLRAFEANYFQWGPYLSPFYSPLIDVRHYYWPYSPALLILAGPLGFRVTCYYYRKAYYRAFFLDPPACGVPERRGRAYCGETRFPFILQNVHRYFLYGAVIFLAFLWHDAVRGFFFENGIGVGVGSIVLVVNVILLTLYLLSCHSLRHLLGGKLDCFSCTNFGQQRYSMWRRLSALNEHHAVCLGEPVLSGLCRFLCPPGLLGRNKGSTTPVKGKYETHEHDVLIIGAGGAGLRAAIEALAQGASVGVVSKSLLGKAHTVMAEGGIAAAMANVDAADDWRIHFRDTMRGGKLLNNWHMAQATLRNPADVCASWSSGAHCLTAPRMAVFCNAPLAATLLKGCATWATALG